MAEASALERKSVAEALSAPAFYDEINARQLAAIENGVAPGCTPPQIAWFLEMARSMNLSPFHREIYAANNNGRLLIMVGRDGLLRKAEDFPDYAGYDCGVVRKGDEFSKGDPDPDGKTLRARAGVSHVEKNDGEIIGAWAVAERRGRPPRYFFARIDEYLPNLPADKLAKSAWGTTTSVMIEKVAISVVHRTLCNLSGVYLQEEVDRMLSMPSDGDHRTPEAAAAETADQMNAMIGELDASLELRDALREKIARLNALSPNSWTVATVQMKLAGRDVESLERELRILDEDIEHAERLRPPAPVEGTAEEEPITDAVVVEDGDPAASGEDPEAVDAEPGDEDDPWARIEHQLADAQAALEDPEIDPEAQAALEARIEELNGRLEARRAG